MLVSLARLYARDPALALTKGERLQFAQLYCARHCHTATVPGPGAASPGGDWRGCPEHGVVVVVVVLCATRVEWRVLPFSDYGGTTRLDSLAHDQWHP
jgi:hypothetical protein